jgi:hypothetical protein
MTLLTSVTSGTGSATGLRRRRRRFLILAIGSGAGFDSGCFFVRRFFLGMPQKASKPPVTLRAGKSPLAAVFLYQSAADIANAGTSCDFAWP